MEHPEIDFATVLASAVHDMKNSLCMLIQSTELIQQESAQLSGDARDELARLNYEANRLNSNLLQLLSLYRLERNQLPVQIDQHSYELGASIGVSRYPEDGDSAERLLQHADRAMYAAKSDGRNTFAFHDGGGA